jgi:hypothetical protein
LRSGLLGAAAVLCAGSAQAASIESSTTTPVATSTAAGGGADNIEITASGAIRPAAAGPIVTLDSDNTVLNSGTLEVQGINDATGVLVQGGHTGSVTNAGTIEVDETTADSDADGDGDLDGAFVTGARRYGVRVVGTQPFTGSIVNQTGAALTVSGDSSAGISVETGLVGSISHSGAMTITGANSYGVHVAGRVSGDVSILGAITALGQNVTAVEIDQDVGGRLTLQSAISNTGYRYITRGTSTVVAKLDADDLLQGGPAVHVAGSLGAGLLVDVPPALDAGNADVDGDGIADSSEAAGAITSYGGAPAIVLGSTGRAIDIGAVGTGADAFGIVNRGTITGSGVYDGVASTALQVGVAGGQAVNVAGGVRNTGTISALAQQAGATAVDFKAGASAPVLRNEGTISSEVTASGAVTAAAVSIEAGANVATLQNGGTLKAAVVGAAGDAVAVQDRSGVLRDIQNVGQIVTSVAPTATTTSDASNQNVTGRSVAIDVSANTSGVSLTQSGSTASIAGDVLFGSGDDRVAILGGALSGAMSLGAGANTLTIDGGASVTGSLTATGGTVAIGVGSGSLSINNTGTVNLTSLSVASDGSLTFTADPAAGLSTRLEVAGPATFADGAKVGVRLSSILLDQASFTLVHAQALSAGAIDSSLLGAVPFLYTAALSTDAAAGTVSVTLHRKTAAELGLAPNAAALYDPALRAANADAGVRDAVLAQTGPAGLNALFSQMTPNHSGAVFEAVSAQANVVAQAIDDRQFAPAGGAWAQETNIALFGDGPADEPGYHLWGVGLAGGYEQRLGGAGVAGVSLGFDTNQLDDSHAQGDENFTLKMAEAGVYWRTSWRGLAVSARLAGDYAHVDSRRVVADYDAAGTRLLIRTAEAGWSAYGGSARVKASYEMPVTRRLYVRPTVSADYVKLHEQGYAESGGGDAIDLSVDSRDSDEATAFAGAAFGATFGSGDASWGPELLVGYRQVVSGGPADTTAHFAGGSDFTLSPDEVTGGGPSVRLSFKGENAAGGIAVEGGAEKRGDLKIFDLRLAAHYMF